MALIDESWKPNFLIERLMELDETIQLIQRFIADNPGDDGLLHDLRNHELRRHQLVDCLQKSLIRHRQHAVSYIFKDATPGSINLDIFLAGLQSFGNLVANTFKELCGSRMDLQFNTTFAGSFGVLLSTPFDDYLMESDFDRGLSAVFDTIENIGEEGTDTKALLKRNLKGNRELIRKFTNFFNGIVKTGSPVEIQWLKVGNHEQRKTFVPVERAKKLQELFAEHAQRAPESMVIRGHIKGISLLRNVVDIQYRPEGRAKNKTLTNIPFTPEMTSQVKDAFDSEATMEIEVKYDYNELTGVEVPHRSLVGVMINPGN